MTDWIEHDGGPQPVADDVWVEINDHLGVYEVEARSHPSWGTVKDYRILNQHLIDAARLEGIRLGLEAAAKVIADRNGMIAPRYVLLLDPETIAKNAKPFPKMLTNEP